MKIDSIVNLVDEDVKPIYTELREGLAKLPDDAFAKLHWLQISTGCLNACRTCSQKANCTVKRISSRSMRALILAIRDEVTTRRPKNPSESLLPLVAYGKNGYKDGVVHPYFDDDVFSNELLYQLLILLKEILHVKVRISTVGYSRHNTNLKEMHNSIVKELSEVFHSIRFSYTPFPRGWNSSRNEYVEDWVDMLSTYRPLYDRIGSGKDGMCVELRFEPLVSVEDRNLEECIIYQHHVIHSGPYLLISKNKAKEIPTSVVSGLDGRSALFSSEAVPYYVAVSDKTIREGSWVDTAQKLISGIRERRYPLTDNGMEAILYEGALYRFENIDGPYYAVDPTFSEIGEFHAIQFYPKTNRRKKSGYLDSSRHLLNSILEYKRERGLGRRDQYLNASWDDVYSVLNKLDKKMADLMPYNFLSAKYIKEHVLPMVNTYIQILYQAGYPPSCFFDKGFTYDSGHIVNQGRASREFKGLVSRDDIYITPHEAREDFLAKQRGGHLWRWTFEDGNNGSLGKLRVEELNPATLLGCVSTYYPGRIEVSTLKGSHLYPGSDN